jgi:hypothetical protein
MILLSRFKVKNFAKIKSNLIIYNKIINAHKLRKLKNPIHTVNLLF